MTVNAYVLINVRAGKTKDVVNAVRAVVGVKTVHACWGTPDVFAFVEAADLSGLGNLVLSSIQTIDGVEHTDTHIVLEL